MIVFESLLALANYYDLDRRKARTLLRKGLIQEVTFYRRPNAKVNELAGYCLVGPSIRALSLKL